MNTKNVSEVSVTINHNSDLRLNTVYSVLSKINNTLDVISRSNAEIKKNMEENLNHLDENKIAELREDLDRTILDLNSFRIQLEN